MTGAKHPAIEEKLENFEHAHLAEPLKNIVQYFWNLAHWLADNVASHPQLTIALQKLIEAKDAAVRARVAELKAAGTPAGPNTPERELTNG
jgi:LmbE family N-acetylglucosaminyl deacetylase